MALQVALLGPVEVLVDGRPLVVDTRKAVALLAYLATVQTTQPRDALAALLWPEYDQENARSSFRRTLSTLRGALGGRWISTRGDAVRLEGDAIEADVVQFREAIAGVRAHAHSASASCRTCADALASAIKQYRGDFMTGFSLRDSLEFEDWQFAQAEALRRDLDTTLASLVAFHEENGSTPEAVTMARRRLELDPINERAHADLMRLYARSGDRTAALRQYRECLRVLDEELGVGPLETTTALYQQIAAGDNALTQEPPQLEEQQAPARAQELPFTGRDRELADLQAFFDPAKGDARVAVIEGEAGIGKSRLLLEATSGTGCFVTQCYEGESNLAYAPLIGILQLMLADADAAARLALLPDAELVEGSRLLPALGHLRLTSGAPPPLDTPASEMRFLEAVRSVLLAGAGTAGVIAFEDIHWADQSTSDLLVFLARRLPPHGARLVLTWRSDEVPDHHQFRRLVVDLRRGQALLHIVLDRLPLSAVEAMASDAPGISPRRIYEETDGVPLFVAEYLATAPQPGEQWPTPPTIADLMRRRLDRLGERERQVLTTAAVIGRSFDFDIVRTASGRSEEETVGALESLVSQGILRPVQVLAPEGPIYDFGHERLRSFVYESLDASRRRLLHRRVGESLDHPSSNRTNTGLAAQHLLLAGDTARASQLFEAAGRRARELHAHAEAVAHFRAALGAGHESPGAIHRAIGELLVLAGSYQAALASLQLAAALERSENLAEIEHEIGDVYLRIGSWELADQHLQAALQGFEQSGRESNAARVLADRSLVMYRLGRAADSLSWANQALRAAEKSKDPAALAQAHNTLGILQSTRGEIEQAIPHLLECVSIAEALNDDSARIAGLNNLALAQRALGEYEQARDLTLRALALCQAYGDRHREAALLNNLADLSRDLGLEPESMAYLKQAVELFAEIGTELGTMEPEIWKLVRW